jgi:hypothetical protein
MTLQTVGRSDSDGAMAWPDWDGRRIGSVKQNTEFSRGTILEAVEQDEDL